MQRRTTLKTNMTGRLGVCSAAFFLLLTVSACGNKGDLYLPAPETAQAEQTTEQQGQ